MNLNRIANIAGISLIGLAACTRETPPEGKALHSNNGSSSAIAAVETPCHSKLASVEQDISAAIDDLPKILEKGGIVQHAEMLREKILSLPDKARQLEWCSKVTNVLFNIECGQFTPRYRYNGVSAVEYLKGQIGYCVYKAGTLEDLWCLKLHYLAWYKRQMEWCMSEYAKIEPRTRVRPIPLSVANRALGLKRMGSSLAAGYEGECDRYEHDFWDDRPKLPKSVSMKVARRFVEILGRPIRMPEQIADDWRKRVEARRREDDAAKTNRPPPLILIDGTK